MIPTRDILLTVARSRAGRLEEIPFAVVLRALAEHGASVQLEIRRDKVEKTIVLEQGVPVECRSNLVHERLGRFLVGIGRLSETDFSSTFSESLTRSVPYGQILIEREIISPSELYRLLQQNLAKKLLDGFSWTDGDYTIRDAEGEVESPLKVRVGQLILTGLTRFAPQSDVDSAVMTLISKRLCINPEAAFPLDELRMSGRQRHLIELFDRPHTLAELTASGAWGVDEVSRLVYPLCVLGVLSVEEDLLEQAARRRDEARTPLSEEPTAGDSSAAAARESETRPLTRVYAFQANPTLERFEEEVMERYLGHRRVGSLELLDLDDTADASRIERRYLEFAERYSPWRHRGEGAEHLHDKLRDLFLSGAKAYAELATPMGMQVAREEWRMASGTEPPRDRIETDLLDPEAQYRRGLELLENDDLEAAEQYLQFASDCDPQNGVYRAELAHCQYLRAPETAERVLSDLTEALRIEPNCGLALFYAGRIRGELGDADRAQELLRRSIKLLAPDRRPIEELKMLQSRRGSPVGKRR